MLACAGCTSERTLEDAAPTPLRRTAGGNIGAGCPAAYDSTIDYFPEKAALRYTEQATLTYHGHYKVLTVTPRQDTTLQVRYALVQCGTPAPEGWDPRRIIEVPVRRFALTHSDYYGVADTLDLYDRLAAVGNESEIYTPRLRQAIAEGRVATVGSQQHLDLERLFLVRPEVILSYWSVSPEWNAPAKVDEAGLKSVALVAHWERHPLGPLDWVPVFAAFFNREGDAMRLVTDVRARYDSIRALAASRPMRPYISFFPTRDRWALQRRDHRNHLIKGDARLAYAFEPLIDSATFPVTSLEAALAAGRDAPFWLEASNQWESMDDVLAADPRLQGLAAARSGEVWKWDKGNTGPGRTLYAEYWILRPDLDLADHVAIAHPGLLRGYETTFARRLAPRAARRGE